MYSNFRHPCYLFSTGRSARVPQKTVLILCRCEISLAALDQHEPLRLPVLPLLFISENSGWVSGDYGLRNIYDDSTLQCLRR